jgi:ribose 5-phosphate isomerase B
LKFENWKLLIGMIIYIGTDHKGFRIKEKVKSWLLAWGHSVEDVGALSLNPDDDYPDFASKVAEKVSENPDSSQVRGIILGATGEGESIVVNKYNGVRCSVYYGGPEEIVALSRDHSDANIFSIGVLFMDEETLQKMIKLWLDKPFSGMERHIRRLKKVKEIERQFGEQHKK